MSDIHERAGTIFTTARTLRGAERQAYLDEACAGDAALRAEVESLLEFDTESTLEDLGDAVTSDLREIRMEGTALPESLGDYRVISRIGTGGMGVVYEAEQKNPKRRVALKVLRADFATPELLRRFEHEAQVLGWLDHPGIARIYEAGTARTDSGEQPFFAMELVRGEVVTDHVDRTAAPLTRRLELVAHIADAIHHAHQKGVIHRDLKPANILVDEQGAPRVLDFGIARVTDADLQRTTLQTREGEILGTLPYMSPEQLGGDPSRVDIRADVYALGVIAFELVTDRLPIAVEDSALHVAARRIVEEEPLRAGQLVGGLPADVDTILAKALEKDPDRRYASAEELAADLRRFLGDEPIAARPPSTIYQLGKFVRRNRALVLGAGATLVALVAGLIVSLSLYFAEADAEERASQEARKAKTALAEEQLARSQADEARRRAEDASALLIETEDYFDSLIASASPFEAGDDVRVVEVLQRTIAGLDDAFPERPLARARLLERVGKSYSLLGEHRESLALLEEALQLQETHGTLGDMERFEFYRLLSEAHHAMLDFVQAEHFARLAVELLERVGDIDGRAMMRCKRDLADALRGQDKLDEALAILEEGVVAARDAGEEIEYTEYLRIVGLVRHLKGRPAQAREALELAIERYTRSYGPESFQTLDAQVILSATYSTSGRASDFARAADLLEENLAATRRLLSGDHRVIVMRLEGLGVSYLRSNRAQQAIETLEEALAMAERLWGAGPNITTAGLRSKIGVALSLLNRFEEAEPMMLEGITELRELSPDSQILSSEIASLGMMYVRLGRKEEALECYVEALDIRLRKSDPLQLRLDWDYERLIGLADELGRFELSAPHHRGFYEARRDRDGLDQRDTVEAAMGYLHHLGNEGNWDAAEELLAEIEDSAEEHFGESGWMFALEIERGWIASRGLAQEEGREQLEFGLELFFQGPPVPTYLIQRCLVRRRAFEAASK